MYYNGLHFLLTLFSHISDIQHLGQTITLLLLDIDSEIYQKSQSKSIKVDSTISANTLIIEGDILGQGSLSALRLTLPDNTQGATSLLLYLRCFSTGTPTNISFARCICSYYHWMQLEPRLNSPTCLYPHYKPNAC